MQWLKDHWGDIASLTGLIVSVIGLIVSLYVLKQARDIRRVVEARVTHYRALSVLELLVEGRILIQFLTDSQRRRKKLSGPDADRLRYVLSEILSHELFLPAQTDEIRTAVGELRRDLDNTPDVKAALRRLGETLTMLITSLRKDTALTEFE